MADLTFIIEIYSCLFVLVIFTLIWKRLGGWPEAWYRIWRTSYFTFHPFGPDRSEGRFVLKMSDINTKTNPPSFTFGEKVWHVNDDAMGRDTGRPAWYYHFEDTEPLPIFAWKKGSKLDPAMIAAAYENDCIERVHRIGRGRSVGMVFWVLLLVVIVIVIVAISAYYNYNTFCAVTPEKCGTGGVRIG